MTRFALPFFVGKSVPFFRFHMHNGPNTLHGGKKGSQYVVWDAKQIRDSILELSYLSRDMEEGFPGNLKVKVVYQLTDNNELKLSYEALTDKKTLVNLTNHAFFNLNGHCPTVLNIKCIGLRLLKTKYDFLFKARAIQIKPLQF